jgi:hypothetical protein
MRRLGTMALAAALLCALGGAAMAQTKSDTVSVTGQLKKIEGKALTLTTPVGSALQETVITCDGLTKFSRRGDKVTPAAFDDLKIGQSLRAYYDRTDNVALGVIIVDSPAPPRPTPSPLRQASRVAGLITKIDGKALTIATVANGASSVVVVICNDATKFSRAGDKTATEVTFADLKLGMLARCYYTSADNAALAIVLSSVTAPAVAAPESPSPATTGSAPATTPK